MCNLHEPTPFLLIWLILCSFNKVYSELSYNQVIEHILEDPRDSLAEFMNRPGGRAAVLAGRAGGGGKLDFGRGNSDLSCGDAFNVAKQRYARFVLNSKHKPCYLAFIGSKVLNCTVGLLCDGTVKFAPPNAKGVCEKEYLTIGDGTIGQMKGCDEFTFSGKPRIPRNTGKDLYVNYKGQSLDSPCVAICIEDLDKSHTNVDKPRRISNNKAFQGFPISENCQCGKRNNEMGRVVGGETALKFEFPWIGALVYKNYPSIARVPKCGASLISDLYIITAAHCFGGDEGEEFQILLHSHVMDKTPTPRDGSWGHHDVSWTPGWNLKKETDASEETVRVDVEKIIMHPLYHPKTFDYDVAILKLKKRVNFATQKVIPVCLPFLNEVYDFTPNDIMVVAGWGKAKETAKVGNRILQKLDMPFISKKNCEIYAQPQTTHFCAGYMEGGKDSCTGDSGGPLIYKFNEGKNQYLLSGIVSSGAGCARGYNPGMYTNVQEVLQWVYHHTANTDALWCGR